MTKRLRIAIIFDLAPRKLGSMEDSIVALAEEAARRSHKMDIFTFPPVHPIVAGRVEAAGSRWINLKTLLGHPFASARQLGREYDVVVLNLFAARGLMARIAYAAIPARVVFVDHLSGPERADRTSAVRMMLDRFTTIRMAGLIAVSDYVLRRDLDRFHVAPPFARRIYNGIDTQRFAPPAAGRRGPRTVIAVAHLIPEKGIEVLIDAFARIDVSDTRLNIVGDGPERSRLENLARSRGLGSRVSFLGWRDDVDALLTGAHVFVHPCIWEEAFGYTLAEALATGCPVVASRIGSTPELVTDGETGLLVPPRDVTALAAAVDSVLCDSSFRELIGANARRSAVGRFSLEVSTNAHLDCYEEVAKD
jgi:glycosyltransferase involved in cell wall biosynthesis